MNAWRWWLVAEAAFAFAIPAYFWVWGVIALPLWILGAASDDPTALLNLASVVGGFLGAIGLLTLLRQIISSQPVGTSKFIFITVLCACGLLAIWTMMTGHLHAFMLNWFTVVAIVAPTLCTVHLLILCRRLLRPNV